MANDNKQSVVGFKFRANASRPPVMTRGSPRATFIVIEGLDRSGKTTQTGALHTRLQDEGIDAQLIKFPDRTTAIGQMIDSYLRSASELDDHAIHLLFSANRWEVATRIEKLLTSGTIVICDRYAFSGIAFSASKVTPAGEPLLPFDWCKSPDVGLPAPDLVIFFDITPEIAKERGGFGQERYETEEMQLRVRKYFHRIGEELSERRENAGEGGTRWVSIDAGKGKHEVAEEVWNLVEPLIKRGDHGPLQKLWTVD